MINKIVARFYWTRPCRSDAEDYAGFLSNYDSLTIAVQRWVFDVEK